MLLYQHVRVATTIRQGVKMLLNHMLSGAPLHLARILNGDDILIKNLLIQNALGRRVNTVVTMTCECQIQVIDMKTGSGPKTRNNFILHIFERVFLSLLTCIVVAVEPLITIHAGFVNKLININLTLHLTSPSNVLFAFA